MITVEYMNEYLNVPHMDAYNEMMCMWCAFEYGMSDDI